MNYNKDLYQIVKIDKNASQQEINTLVLRVSPKDNPEVGKALMVLTDPQKRIEFDKSGWKDEWERDWQEERDFRHSIFKSIQNYKHHYNNTEDYTPDGHRIWVAVGIDLDPNLWTPFQDRSVGWIDKIWGIYGENWKQELENFRDKILVALDEAWEKAKKTLSSDIWESVEGGNCAECGKQAKLRWKDRERHSDKVYCSKDCAFENMKIKYEIPKYEPEKRKTPLRDKRIPNKNELKYKCSNCGKKYDGAGWGSVDSDGNRYNYCSETCCNNHNNKQPNPNNVSPIVNKLKAFLAKKNPHQEEITQTEYNRLTGNLVIEYDSGSSTLKDNELTKEQKEIKEFFQTVGETQINRNDLEQAVNQQVNFVPGQDAEVIKLLGKKKGRLLGKTALDELACGGTGLHANTGSLLNPFNPFHIVGGSSSGSAQIVAQGLVPFALGHDTGDSVRRPAAYCGVVGFKPSYGLISRSGVIPLAASLDTVGVLGKQVKDIKAVFSIIAQPDPADLTTIITQKDLGNLKKNR